MQPPASAPGSTPLLTWRVSAQSVAGFPVSPRQSSWGKYSCLPAPACWAGSAALPPRAPSCISWAVFLSATKEGAEGTRQQVLVKCWLVAPAAQLLEEGVGIRAMGARLSAWGPFQRQQGQHRDKVMSPPMGHMFHGWTINHSPGLQGQSWSTPVAPGHYSWHPVFLLRVDHDLKLLSAWQPPPIPLLHMVHAPCWPCGSSFRL